MYLTASRPHSFKFNHISNFQEAKLKPDIFRMPPKRRPSAGGRKSLGKNLPSPEKAPENDNAQVTKLKVENQKLTNELDETRQQLEKLQNEKNRNAQSLAESEEVNRVKY